MKIEKERDQIRKCKGEGKNGEDKDRRSEVKSGKFEAITKKQSERNSRKVWKKRKLAREIFIGWRQRLERTEAVKGKVEKDTD